LVVAVEQAVAAPFCTSRLADAGARVIKIERAEGDFARAYDRHVKGESTYFVWLNRGKQSVCLDLKAPADIDILTRMIARADVLVQNLAPGAMARMGLGSDVLRARHPRLITCDISGYGDAGPYRDMKAYDLLVQAETGICSLTGGPEAPARVGVSVCDIAAGQNAHAGILQALFAREKTGQGRGIKVSLFGGMADWMNVAYLQRRYGGEIQPRLGLIHPTLAPYGVFTCCDGQILLSIQNEREWLVFCRDVMNDTGLAVDPAFDTMPRRVTNRAALEARVAAVFAPETTAEIACRLKAASIAFGLFNTVDGLITHPQLRTVEVETTAGPISIIAPPIEIAGVDGPLGPVPALGADTDTIRREFAA
jgi:itaconate CoA-transferase